jgi:S1-C subfamily serine protease
MSFFVPIEVLFDLFLELNPPWASPRILGVIVDQELRSSQMQNGECRWHLTVSAVSDGSIADVADITPGDELISVNDIPLMSVMHLRMVLQRSPATTNLVVLRDGKEITLKLSFSEDEGRD